MNDETPLSDPSLEGVEMESPMEAAPADERDAEILVLKEETAALKDRLLRMAAEMENLRKRTEREKADRARQERNAQAELARLSQI